MTEAELVAWAKKKVFMGWSPVTGPPNDSFPQELFLADAVLALAKKAGIDV